MQIKNKLFFDMDGTLAFWRPATNFEELMVPGYFLNLKPTGLIKVVKELQDLFGKYDFPFEIEVLTAVLGENQAKEKRAWLDKHGLKTIPMTVVPYGENKANYIKNGFINVLVDDLSKNLFEFIQGGNLNYGIKYYNSINGTNGSWERIGGNSISWQMQEEIGKDGVSKAAHEIIHVCSKAYVDVINKTLKERGLDV